MDSNDLAAMRHEYEAGGLSEEEAGDDPYRLFDRWMVDAMTSGLHEPNAMVLATATADGRPSVRTVLLKGLDDRGAMFYTNYESRKGRELAENPRAAVVMPWHPLQRQVRFEGVVTKADPLESDAYFMARPEGGRISAAASPQSQPVAGRSELERLWAKAQERGAGDQRPEHWGGYRIVIDTFEFWQGRRNRFHDRIRFRLDGDRWLRDRLAP
ncbi:pyridoxamine 5'-phosphate oxidase [Aeromicrobium phragmitis]|uniref:Pyridoxine/pyridoxamine 5'-phosphate oxidase n=1 Tax=Aeromicrobium phragmitis TaxID=2478914 RepID=A0A3L8PIN4_9ACTN|nr:pyridoxamine 5'-phosphate oxidase [Aeromicrobium phragmitis]RLV55091.1 pyridoxamine 5'-phosphate oxidase [Aeromicrobium phragmitis]